MIQISDESFLAAINDFRDLHGYAPTEADIAAKLGVSHTTVNRRLHRLENTLYNGRILFGKKLGGGFGRERVWFYLTSREAAFFGVRLEIDTNTQECKEQ